MGGQGLQLCGEVLNQRSNAGRCSFPVALENPGRWKCNLELSLSEIQAGLSYLSRLIPQGLACSTPEQAPLL